MSKDFWVPVLRYVVAAGVAGASGWVLDNVGLEITTEQQDYLTGTLTTFGAALMGTVALSVSKWLKPRFLRAWHPGEKRVLIKHEGIHEEGVVATLQAAP